MEHDFRPTRIDRAGIVIPIFLILIAAIALLSSSLRFLSWQMPIRVIGYIALFAAPVFAYRYRFLYYSYVVGEENGQTVLVVYSYFLRYRKKVISLPLRDIVSVDLYPASFRERYRLKKMKREALIKRAGSEDFRVNLFAQSSYLITVNGNTPTFVLLEIDEPFATLLDELSKDKMTNS